MMTKLTNGIVVTSEIKSLILDYLNEALDFELRGELEKMHFPYESVKQFQEYKTFEEIKRTFSREIC